MSAPRLLPRSDLSAASVGAAAPVAVSSPEPTVTDARALSRAARAVRIAAADDLALAARTDHIKHLCRETGSEGLDGVADAYRRHAEDMDQGAAFLARCAAIPGLPAMIEAMERGTVFVPVEPVAVGRAPLPRDVVVVGQDDAPTPRSRVGRVLSRLKRGA